MNKYWKESGYWFHRRDFMKRVISGFLFFFCVIFICLLALFRLTDSMEYEKMQDVEATESYQEPVLADEEPVHLVLNQDAVSHQHDPANRKNRSLMKQEPGKLIPPGFYLVSEEGYLIVYDTDRESVELVTHMPVGEFPVEEQERLMAGIWFISMSEILSYLESYSS